MMKVPSEEGEPDRGGTWVWLGWDVHVGDVQSCTALDGEKSPRAAQIL